MASPQSFTLDRSIFNDGLYQRMRDFWFADLPPDSSMPNMATMQKWFGVGVTPQDKKVFDDQCHENFGVALKSLAPENLALPPFESYEKDIEQASTIALPFLSEVREAQSHDPQKGSETLLSLILLLDQMPRNIFRDPAGLRLVYQHYDRLAYTLLRSSMSSLTPDPTDSAIWVGKPVYRTWYLLPLMHSEHLPSHGLFDSITRRWRAEAEESGATEAVQYMDRAEDSAVEHLAPLQKFGRYPHRNGALGRKTTKEEEEFMKSEGKSFGVEQDNGGKDEGKSEL